MQLKTFVRSMFCAFVVAGILLSQDAWRRKHDLGNRYEGLIDIPTASSVLDVLSFTSFFQPFDRAEEWRVRYYSPIKATVMIYARDLDEQVQYWMESYPQSASPHQWSEFQKWDTGPVLIRENVAATRVGVTAKLSDADGSTYIPAMVYPANTPIPAQIASYRIQLRANFNISRLDYTVTGVTPRGSASPVLHLPGERVAGAPFPLDVDVQKFSDGPMRVVISAFKGTQLVASKELSFFHKKETVQ
jgi:hypothetical protein